MARTRRRRGVRVRRQIRRIELWPLARVGFVFHLVSFGTTLGAGVLLYHAGNRSGLIDRFTSFLGEIGFAEDFVVDGEALLRAVVPAGFALVLFATVCTVLAGALYNVVSGLLGGLIFSVIEDRPPRVVQSVVLEDGTPTGEQAATAARTGRRLRRRARRAEAAAAARTAAAGAVPAPPRDRERDRERDRDRDRDRERGRGRRRGAPAAAGGAVVAAGAADSTLTGSSFATSGPANGWHSPEPAPVGDGSDDDWFTQPAQ